MKKGARLLLDGSIISRDDYGICGVHVKTDLFDQAACSTRNLLTSMNHHLAFVDDKMEIDRPPTSDSRLAFWPSEQTSSIVSHCYSLAFICVKYYEIICSAQRKICTLTDIVSYFFLYSCRLTFSNGFVDQTVYH
ncbi:hypothetical protein BIW11_09815 [Tropilaelaps mercedesae]|uniref:Uncharacterized protein n=1 Tax=Tropilaelaps mercedesae TaxID=418985 RepID=A0A1V9XIF9_9ACAR|nr:hypothetical protein BIW11_09815 [Tropilaelaps mercedesae]